MSGNSATILAEISRMAPPGPGLDEAVLPRLRELSAALVAASGESAAEFRRYLSVAERSIEVPDDGVREYLAGRTVLVTGASGCIGTALLRRLARDRPGRLVALDLVAPRAPVAAYHQVDVRDRDALVNTVTEIKPDVVFHAAAQRDPSLAERAVHRTVTTNVFGTRNLVEACAQAGTDRLVLASTGKALRPYTPDVYAASKRVAELIVADAATRGVLRASAARFTHVVDNAIVLDRFRSWCRRGEVVRLHSVDSMFYAQSARESAQLMLVAAVTSAEDGLGLHAIRNLGWPVALLDVALGAMAEQGVAPLHISGYDPGYEEQAFPGLYDPTFAGDLSPLINSFEAPGARASASPDVDLVVNKVTLPEDARHRLDELDALCETERDAEVVRDGFDLLSRTLLEVTLASVPQDVLRRVVDLARPHVHRMNETNMFIHHRVRMRAGQVTRPSSAPVGIRNEAAS
ncbi:polysaccharide biosynthesis protein [Amycolatopsis coloradensis]|uniref:Polysaccharide biosynthesis protein n=1 Tax=Amycolatopsis coloradensis TaxID=76021 RepID=A0ACD5BA82_9PSEU